MHILQQYDFFGANNTAYVIYHFLKGKTLRQFIEDENTLQVVINAILNVTSNAPYPNSDTSAPLACFNIIYKTMMSQNNCRTGFLLFSDVDDFMSNVHANVEDIKASLWTLEEMKIITHDCFHANHHAYRVIFPFNQMTKNYITQLMGLNPPIISKVYRSKNRSTHQNTQRNF